MAVSLAWKTANIGLSTGGEIGTAARMAGRALVPLRPADSTMAFAGGAAHKADYRQQHDHGAADDVPVVIGEHEVSRIPVRELLP